MMLIISKWKNLSSGAAFMFSLALADFQSSFFDGVIDELLPSLQLNLKLLSGRVCAVYTFISNLTTVSSFYLTALFCVDKCISVTFPFKYRECGKPKVCLIATLSVYAFLALVLSPVLFVFDLDETKNVCRVSNFEIINKFLYFKIRLPVSIVLVIIVPILTVMMCTTITAIKLRFDAKKRKKRAPNQQNQKNFSED